MEVGVEVVHARDCKLLLDTDIYKVVRKGRTVGSTVAYHEVGLSSTKSIQDERDGRGERDIGL